MKKIALVLFSLTVLFFLNPSDLDAKPFFIKIKIGIFAKWSITFNGDCEDGKGICLALGNTSDPNSNLTFFGYDDATNQFCIKVSKQWSNAKSFSSGTFEVGEDSPIDPKVISNIPTFKNTGKMVILNEGTYHILDDGEFYLLNLNYHML